MSEVTFTAVAEVTLDGQLHITPPMPFTLAGISMTLETRKASDGANTVHVRAGPPPQPGYAHFDKLCTQPVAFKLFRNDEPMQLVEIRSMFQRISLNLMDAA